MDNRLYWAELQHIRRLEPEEEQSLWRQYKEQDRLEARQKLIESYQPLVFKTAAKFHAGDSAFMDLVQEGTVGLIEATENYDHCRGVAFSLYALHRIRGRMLNFLSNEGRRQEQVYLDELALDSKEQRGRDVLVDPAPSLSQQVEQAVAVAAVTQAMERLPDKEQVVLAGVFLADQEPGQLADQLEVSISHIYRLQKQGVRRVRGMLSRWMQHW